MANGGSFESLFAIGFLSYSAVSVVAVAAVALIGYILGLLLSKRKPNEDPKGTNMKITAFGGTHVGGRANNEDAFLIQDDGFVVADGMGGMARGEEASATLIEAFRGRSPSEPAWFKDSLAAAHQRMQEMVAEDPVREGFATTVTAVRRSSPTELQVHWAGDSPLFRLRAGVLEQVTEDHSLAVYLWKTGQIEKNAIAKSPVRNVLYKNVGAAKAPEWDELSIEVEAGDRYLICSDGLVDYTDLAKVATILGGAGAPEERVSALIANALADKTRDNATAIVIDIS